MAITSISPSTFVIGTSGTMTIYGSGLSGKGTPTLQFSVGGITTSNVTVVSDTEVTANYTVSCSFPAQSISLKFPSDNLTTNTLSVGAGLPAAPAPGITFGGNNIAGTTQSVVVGQQIALTASVPSLPACMSLSSQSWSTPPGYAVGGFSHSLDSGAVAGLPASNASSYTFYWAASGSSLQMTYQYTMAGGGGQVTSPAATATFNISAPTSVTMTTPTSQVAAYSDSGTPYLGFGTFPLTLGIQFNGTATPPPGDSGTFFYEQLIGVYNVVRGASCSYSLGTGLDTSDPYSSGSLSTNDSPRTPLYSSEAEVTADFSATMYLMWQSGTSGSIPVPLGYVNWQWSGDAVQNSGTWSLKSGSGSSDGFVSSSTYPAWNTHYTPGPPPCQ